jgi:hypothetical protein
MAIPSRATPSTPLFHSVDLHFSGDFYVLTFSPANEQDARSINAGGYLPYLRQKYPDAQRSLDMMFTSPAVDRAQETTWDGTTFSAKTPEIIELDKYEEDDDEYNFSDNVATTGTVTAISGRPDPSHLQQPLLVGDNDSVSTFRTKATTTPTNAPTNPPPQATTVSVASPLTVDDRLDRLESNSVTTSATLQTLSMQMAQLLQLVQQPTTTPANTNTTTTTSSSKNPSLEKVGFRP